jgi:hypothetical protein
MRRFTTLLLVFTGLLAAQRVLNYTMYDVSSGLWQEGQGYGPVDVGGSMTARCAIIEEPPVPPTVRHVSLYTGANYIYVGIVLPGGQRTGCRTIVSWLGEGYEPPPWPGYPGGPPPAPGIGAGAIYVDWTYLFQHHHCENWLNIFCNGNIERSNGLYRCDTPQPC